MKRTPTPIWHNFSGMFLYGFHQYPLLLAVAISILIYATGDGFLGWTAAIILNAMIFKYAFVVLQQTARGDMTPPPLNWEVLAGDYDLPLKFYALFVFFVLVTGALFGSAGSFLGMLFVFFGLLVFPASIMLLALNESFVDAINPVLLWRLIISIKWSYLALYGLLFILQIAQANVTNVLVGGFAETLLYVVMIYFTIVTFHVMGYILYQNHDVLGHPVEPDDEETMLQDQRLSHFENMMTLGNREAAMVELQELTNEYPDDLDIRRRLHQLWVLEQKGDRVEKHNREYLPLLLKAGRDVQAVEAYQDCQRLGGSCNLNEANDCYRLAQGLSRAGQHKEVVKLLNGLHKRFPQSEIIPQAYLLVARTLCESLNQDDLALKALRFVIKTYPQHSLIPEVQGYLDTLERIAQ